MNLSWCLNIGIEIFAYEYIFYNINENINKVMVDQSIIV